MFVQVPAILSVCTGRVDMGEDSVNSAEGRGGLLGAEEETRGGGKIPFGTMHTYRSCMRSVALVYFYWHGEYMRKCLWPTEVQHKIVRLSTKAGK